MVVVVFGVMAHGAVLRAQTTAQLSAEVLEYVRVRAPVLALSHVRIIDGTGAPTRHDQTILIEGGRITAIAEAGEAQVPASAETMDLRGHTVVPGFIGLHDHTYYTAPNRFVQLEFSAPRLYLGGGVTTIRTTGSIQPYTELNLKHLIEAGEMPGPTMLVSGPYLNRDRTFVTDPFLNGPEDARRVVAYWAEEGVSWFKAYTAISRAELAAAIEEAHRHGIKVTGHLCSVTFREAVTLGIDNLEHGYSTMSDFDPAKVPDLCPPTFQAKLAGLDILGEQVQTTIRYIVENNVPLTSTLSVSESIVPGRPPLDQRVLDALAPAVREEYLAWRERRDGVLGSERELRQRFFKKEMQFEFEFVKAGGLLASGVDPANGVLPGFGNQRNYELLMEAGFTSAQAIQIMSANGAKVLGIIDQVGTVTVGKRADLVVIEGDPEANPALIRNVAFVFKNGVGYDSAKLIESVSGVVGER